MKRLLFLVLTLILPLAVWSQEDDIKLIRERYAEVQGQISLATTGEPGGLYCNELTVNSHRGSWRAVGNYQKTVKFWYDDQPEFAEDKPLSVLCKIEISSEWSAGNKESWELLYMNGKLAFAFRKDASYENAEKPLETRWYFNGNEDLIRYMEGQQIIKEAPSYEFLINMSQDLTTLFLKTF